MITFLLGFFGYYDKKILSLTGTKNLLYLPYLMGYNMFLCRDYNKLPFGIYCFIGEQGSGKTLSLVYRAYQLKKLGYNSFYSNMTYDGFTYFNKIDALTFVKDAIVICDEMGIVANSKTSKDINADLLRFSAQNRKNHRIVLTTSQQLYQIHKDLRSQIKFVIKTDKIGAFVINRYYKPIIDADGNITIDKCRKFDFFIATKKLYDLYNTCEVIQ